MLPRCKNCFIRVHIEIQKYKTNDAFRKILEILRYKVRKQLVFPTPTLFDSLAQLEFTDEKMKRMAAKSRGMRLLHGEHCMILTCAVSD